MRLKQNTPHGNKYFGIDSGVEGIQPLLRGPLGLVVLGKHIFLRSYKLIGGPKEEQVLLAAPMCVEGTPKESHHFANLSQVLKEKAPPIMKGWAPICHLDGCFFWSYPFYSSILKGNRKEDRCAILGGSWAVQGLSRAEMEAAIADITKDP